MSGYIDLDRTGFDPFDAVLDLLEEAGTAYHHTSQWVDEGWNGERPYIEQINEKIAAARIALQNLEIQSSASPATPADRDAERDAALEEAAVIVEAAHKAYINESGRRVIAAAIRSQKSSEIAIRQEGMEQGGEQNG